MTATELLNKYPTLWQLAEIMEDAVAQVEADERYTVNMQYWHIFITNKPWEDGVAGAEGKCMVCAAGAVMAKYLNRPIKDDLYFVANEPNDEEKLANVLNDLRMGAICDAYRTLYGKQLDDPRSSDCYLDKYFRHPQNWHANVKAMIQSLKEWGI